MLQVAAFTGGVAVPSARFRVRQHIPALTQYGISVQEMDSHFGVYPPQKKWIRPLWASATLVAQIPNIIKSHSCDVVLLQREMLSSFVTLESLTKKPRVLDVDDAIFLYKNGGFARRLAQISNRVICGNSYLANWFSVWNKDVVIIPTAVDTERYVPASKRNEHCSSIVIGWIGTSGNLSYVYAIEAALAKILKLYPTVKLKIVCDRKPEFRLIDNSRYKFVAWSESIEVESIQSMDIGIMPLENSEWAKGKCSFKMLQYMACGKPVVVSPIGMNAEVLAKGHIGVGASTEGEWVDALASLLDDHNLRQQMGDAARQVIDESFSLIKITPLIAKALTL